MKKVILSELKRVISSFFYSLEGIKDTFKSENSFKLECFVLPLAIAFIFVIKVTIIAKIFMISSLVFIFIAELINTAIETVVDRISEENHILSKKAKDIGCSIVFLSIVHALIIWTMVLFL